MSTPRQQPSRAVYRRRRTVLLGVIIVLVAAVAWLFIAQPWAGANEGASLPGTPTQTPGATDAPDGDADDPDAAATPPADGDDATDPSASPDPEVPAGPPECVAADVLVEAITDKVTYPAGEMPQLSIQLTNTGKDCTLNVGTTQQTLTVMSGGDTWWRSTDCQSEPSDMIVLLEAGKTVGSASPVVWDRTRSNPSTCEDPQRPPAPGGGASYHVDVEIGGIPAQSTQQILLY